MGRPASVSLETVHQIKCRIWDGADHKTVQEEFGVAYQMSVNIKGGRQYPYVPWPDGSTGELPKMRVEQLALAKRRATITGKALNEPPRAVARLEDIQFMDMEARKIGFLNNEAMFQHFLHMAVNERMARENEEQRLRSEAYEESERLRLLPENVEARRLARETLLVERDDICDPNMQEMIDESELEGLDIPVVQVAKSEMDEALILAIRICFKLFTRRQWTQDHVLKNIYMIKGKIERYWEEHPGEQTAL